MKPFTQPCDIDHESVRLGPPPPETHLNLIRLFVADDDATNCVATDQLVVDGSKLGDVLCVPPASGKRQYPTPRETKEYASETRYCRNSTQTVSKIAFGHLNQ